jgi:hypothetical protein
LLAEEMAMLYAMTESRLIVGMLRGTTNEVMTCDLNPDLVSDFFAAGASGKVQCFPLAG